MFDSQVKIAEKLNSLNLEEDVKQFFVHVMEFYKGHIKKLQAIIMSKQEEVDEALQLKNSYEERMIDMQGEIERLHEELRGQAEQVSRANREEMELTIQSLKEDLNSRIFEQTVHEDTLRNLRAQNDSLKSQNALLLSQLNAAKAEAADLRQRAAKGSGMGHVPEELRKEINNLRADLNNVKNATGMDSGSKTANNFYPKQAQEVRAESRREDRVEVRNEPVVDNKPKRFHHRGGGGDDRPIHGANPNSQNGPVGNSVEKRADGRGNITARPPVIDMDDRPLDVGRGRANNPPERAPVQQQQPVSSPPSRNVSKFDNMRPDEIEGYYKFLLEEEKKMQQAMWKLPAKAKSKVEKMEISETRKRLDDLTAELEEVRAVLKR